MKIGFLSDLHIMHNTRMMEEALDVVIQAAKNAKVDKLFIAGDTTENYKANLENYIYIGLGPVILGKYLL